MADVVNEWVQTEISSGRFQVENEKYRISVFADFSGQITDQVGNTVQFVDLRDFIDAGKLLESALLEHYGGYK